MEYTNEQLLTMRLLSYERTRSDAIEIAKDHTALTGERCVVINLTGQRARKDRYDKPWQVRIKG